MYRIVANNKIYEWVAPIDYGSVVLNGADLFPNAGTLYHDASVRKNNGTLVNEPTWQWVQELGRWGLNLTAASSQFVNLGQPDSLNVIRTSPLTLSCWIYQDAFQSGQIICKGYGSTHPTRQYQLFTLNTGILHGSHASTTTSNTAGLVAGKWQHIALLSDGSNSGVVINGSTFAATVANNSANDSVAMDAMIGARRNTSNANVTVFANCRVADPMILNVKISNAQLAWLANPANNPWQPWRRKWWPIAPTAVPGIIFQQRVGRRTGIGGFVGARR